MSIGDCLMLIDELNDFCDENVTLFAFANISKYKDRIVSDELKEFDYAISVAINIPDDIIDNLDDYDGELKYRKAYSEANMLLDDATQNIINIIKCHGFDAINVDASFVLPNGKLEGDISHKLVAYLAGLGWIGKSTLLINPYYGPRLRWATVLTNAVLPVDDNIMKSRCDNCNLCVVNCPSNAFKNVEFDENQPRESRYDAFKCEKYFDKLESLGRPRLCGLCVKVCPWGLVNKNSRKKEDIIKI